HTPLFRSELVAPVQPLARIDVRLVARRGYHRAVPVELDLVNPAVAGRHRVDQSRQLRRADLGRLARSLALGGRLAFGHGLVAFGRLVHDLRELIAARALQRILAFGVGRDLGHRAAGQHRSQATLDQWIAFLRVFVRDFAQEPVFALLARLLLQADQQPFALHPLAFEREVEVAFVDVLPALALDRLPGTAVPQHYRAAAVFAFGNDPLEVGIGHGVVLCADREALDFRIGGRAFGHRPRLQDAIGLEAQIPVQAGRVVLLDDEAVAALVAPALAGGLFRLFEVALAVVFRQEVWGAHSTASSSGKSLRSTSPSTVSIKTDIAAPITTSGHCAAPHAIPITAASHQCAAVVRFLIWPLLNTISPAPTIPAKAPAAS